MQKSDFKLLNADAFELFFRYSEHAPRVSCEVLWSNLQLYMDTYKWHYLADGEYLWIVSFDQQYLFYPLGGDIAPERLLDWLKNFAECCPGEFTLGDVPPDYQQKFPQAAEYLALTADPGEADYIYDLAHLQAFSGSKLRKRHNQVRQFEREYENNYRVESITVESLPEIIDFSAALSAEYWADGSGLEEKLAMARLPELWSRSQHGLLGVMLRVREQLAGFAICGRTWQNMAVVHFEKADHKYRGCGAKLTAALTEYLLQNGFCKMNREQDLNDPGLRRAKQALDPEYLYCRQALNVPEGLLK